jgi:Asp-tRNA(Asn)/Glu-tRNA(Gln) amidotransferase B subunit
VKIINPKYFEYDEPTERLAKEMIKEVLDNFTEREIVMKDEDFIQSNFIQIIYRLNEGKLGEMFLKYVFHMIVEKYVKNEIKPDTV